MFSLKRNFNKSTTPKLTRPKYNEYKRLLKDRLTGFELRKMLTVLGIDKEQLSEARVVTGVNIEKTIANMIARGGKLIPKRADERIRRILTQELENKFLRDKKTSARKDAMSVQKNAVRRERFSQFLEFLRSDQGFSLSKVAENIGISVQGLYKIKRRESNPSKQTVILLQIKYGLNPTWYETGREEMLLSLAPERIKQSDEIMLELLRMKNKVIEELDRNYVTLKSENTSLKKKFSNC